MKLNEAIVAPEYEDLLSFSSIEDEDKHNATTIMFRFLSGIEDATKDKISRKKLADLIGTSPSYITQLFRGDKLINLLTLAKLEKALNISFEIKAVPVENSVETIGASPNDIENQRKSKSITSAVNGPAKKEKITNTEDIELALTKKGEEAKKRAKVVHH